MLDWFLAYYNGGDQPVHFSASYFKNLVYTPNAHTVEIDLGKENHLTYSQTFKFTGIRQDFTLTSFKS
jgi:hypothetical protein